MENFAGWMVYTSPFMKNKITTFMAGLPEDSQHELKELLDDFAFEAYAIGLQDGEQAEETRKEDAWERSHG